MADHKELYLFGRSVPSKADENSFIERVIDAANNRNRNGSKPTKAISSIPANDIRQIVVGQSSIGFLFSNNQIGRLEFEIVESVVPLEEKAPPGQALTSSSGGADAGSGSSVQPSSSGLNSGNGGSGGPQSTSTGFGSSSSAATRTAKIRRMMITARRPGAICGRTGVIIDRSRATLPASSIPEELIAQAQVVLQGKSREVIVRELQRTNLNVNEAVNNLLSRDDDEDDLDEAGEYLHEELLSLLDAGLRGESGAAVIDGDSLYGGAEGYDYLISQDRRRSDQKPKERKVENTAPTEITQENFKFADDLQYWHDAKGEDFPAGVRSFTKIAATYSSLYALGNNGKIYTWDWKSELPSNKPHSISEKLSKEDADEKICDLESCPWRVVVSTNKNRVASFVDTYCGEIMENAFYTGFVEIPSEGPENLSGKLHFRLLVCPLYAAVSTSNNKIYWWGVVPYVDRMQAFENLKKKNREDLSNRSIVVGSEVRTRAIPIYASGSVGVNFSSGIPVIGVLMESAWTMSETCRFRVFSPDQYAIYTKEKASQLENVSATVDLNVTRKRAAPSSELSSITSAQYKEEAWQLKDITFFYEEPVCDTAVVKIIDGSFVGIVYKSAIEQNERENNGMVDEIQLLKNSIRLMRKDELIVVPTMKISRSPQVHQRKLTEVRLTKRINKILSVVVENNCFRVLAEKSNGSIAIITTNASGSEATEQPLQVDPAVLTNSDHQERSQLSLENCGDQNMLVLRDSRGSIVPLIPDSANGFREPSFVGFASTRHLAVGLRYSNSITSSIITSTPVLDTKLLRNSESPRGANRILLLAALVAPEPRTTEPKIDSLIQNIQYCDLKKVNQILQELEESADENERRFQILESYTDGNRNIFHTAVMNAFSITNREQGDDYTGVKIDEFGVVTVEGGTVEATDKQKKEVEHITEADAVSLKFDQRWKEMINSEPTLSRIMGSSSSSSSKTSSSKASKEKDQPVEEDRRKDTNTLPLTARQRQKSSILIIGALASSKVVQPYFDDLMRQRDLHGYTPFYSAIQMRAYSAALLMWTKLCDLQKGASVEALSDLAFSGAGNDSVLFLLCYNDTCSFSWTGEEHINQDIFECKTCDLVGSLCCCTECAFTCHRDHNCKLKRTSPTAYCDCWEKCGCKALVAGNQAQRENLLNLLLQNTNLITLLNSRSEHLLLFLARFVGRQLVEQENFPKRTKIRSTAQATSNNTMTIPEHNLEPPKFAITALHSLLGRWAPVKSLLKVGIKEKNLSVPITEDLFHLNEQSGASHLDKFVFMLLARTPESALDSLLNTLVGEANRLENERDPEVDELISRFVRAVIRLFSFLCVSSQMAMNTTLTAISSILGSESGNTGSQKYQLATSVTPSSSSAIKNLQPNYRTITASGVLAFVRNSMPISMPSPKENKKKQINSFVLKCRRVFQILITYSLTELLNSSDSLIAPVRLGIVKPGISIHRNTGSTDPLDVMDKYLHSENDYSSTMKGSKQKRNRFRTQQPDDENRGSDNSDSDDDSDHPSRRQPGSTTFASNIDIAENAAENASWPAAFRVPEMQDNANVNDDNNELSEDSLSEHEGEEGQQDLDQADPLGESDGSGEDENYGERHYFSINEEDVVDESADEYSDDEEDQHYESGDSPMYDPNDHPFDEIVQQQSGGHGHRRKHRRHRRSTTNQSDHPANPEEQMDQDDTSTNAGGQSDQARSTNAEQGSTGNQDAVSSGNDNPISGNQNDEENSNRPRTISTFRNLFNGEASSPSRSNQPPNQNYTTQSPSIGWAVRRVRPNDASATDPAVTSTAGERNPITTENNNAEGTEVNSRHPKPKQYNSSENDVFQTKIQLGASFSLILKTIDELLLRLIQHDQYSKQTYPGINQMLELDGVDEIAKNFKDVINERISVTWEWFAKIMDKLEVMLRFGNALLRSPVGSEISPDVAHSAASLNQNRRRKKTERKEEQHPSSSSYRRDFFGYYMSLMRAHTHEQGDDLPSIDSSPFRHMAMLAEAYLFHINVAEIIDKKLKVLSNNDEVVETSTKETDEQVSPKEIRRFYKRSNSISYPFITSAESQNAFKYSSTETAPLATRSSLLKPESDKAELFSLPAVERTVEEHVSLARDHGFKHPTKMSVAETPLRYEDVMKGLIREESMQIDLARFDETDVDQDESDLEAVLGIRVNSTRLALTKTLGRWGNSLSYLAKAFSEDIIEYSGNDSFNSILLNELGGFLLKHGQFKSKMEKFKSGLSKDLNFSQLTRDKHTLIDDVFAYLNTQHARRTTNSSSNIDPNNSPPLASNRVKATFSQEPGEGSGVVRSFFTAFAESIADMEYLPKEESSSGFGQSGSSSSRNSLPRTTESNQELGKQLDTLPLFCRTRFGFLAPVPGSNSAVRKNAFRNVGRIIGLCLQQMEILPLPLCRHVLKFILSRQITWYDLVFFDPDMFDSLRSIVYDEKNGKVHEKEFYDQLGLTFVIDIPPEEGSGTIELKPGGDKIDVNKDNVLEYVYLLVQKRLLADHVPALESMKQGVFDVIPIDSLSTFSSEDLRLTLCGPEQVSIRLLEAFTSFLDESGRSDMIQTVKKWFFDVISKFTDKEKQDLLFFWTGSPFLPPTEETFTPLPTVMIRPADDIHLVTANTCISRLYLPLYSSKKILRTKLLLAIKCRDFGFV